MYEIRVVEVTRGLVADNSSYLAIAGVGVLKNTTRVGGRSFANPSQSTEIVELP